MTVSDCGVKRSRSGTDEKRYEIDPSTIPTEPSWYDVAKLVLAREDSVSRSPRGVWKFRSATHYVVSTELRAGIDARVLPSLVTFSAAYELSRFHPVAS